MHAALKRILKSYDVILASRSPRRAELIKKTGYNVKIIPADADENISFTNLEAYAGRLSAIKAFAVSEKHNGLVIGADTVVFFDGKVYNKPSDMDDAYSMLLALSGNTHKVITGITVTDGKKTVTKTEISKVAFKPFTRSDIKDYVESGKPLDKAGAYGIQDADFKKFVLSLCGNIDNVIGLPVELLRKTLEENF